MTYQKINNYLVACFSKDELLRMFKIAKKTELLKEMVKRGFSFDDLRNDYSKMKEVSDVVGERGAQDRDEHEIFAAVFIFLDFYEISSEVCFKLKSDFNSHKDRIVSLQDLNKFRTDPPDFIIKSTDGFREFELKRYRDGLNTEEIFNFIKKKVAYYANDLGDMNLLLVPQSIPYSVSSINFHELHKQLKSLNFKFEGQILISYNENNKESVINQVYPELATKRIPFKLASEKLH